MSYPKLIENLIANLSKFPGVGRRSAERMVFWLLDHARSDVENIAESILAVKDGLMFCSICNNLSETATCLVCDDPKRDQSIVCVVENPKDLLAIEKTGAYKGLYHVLLGNICPSEGRGPDEIRINHLLNRVASGTIREVVIATDPDNEGEMTSLYLTKQLKVYGVKVTRIGIGLPMGRRFRVC